MNKSSSTDRVLDGRNMPRFEFKVALAATWYLCAESIAVATTVVSKVTTVAETSELRTAQTFTKHNEIKLVAKIYFSHVQTNCDKHCSYLCAESPKSARKFYAFREETYHIARHLYTSIFFCKVEPGSLVMSRRIG